MESYWRKLVDIMLQVSHHSAILAIVSNMLLDFFLARIKNKSFHTEVTTKVHDENLRTVITYLFLA